MNDILILIWYFLKYYLQIAKKSPIYMDFMLDFHTKIWTSQVLAITIPTADEFIDKE